MEQHLEPAKQAVDVLSFGTAIAALAGWLPALAALFTIVWTGIRIYESRTVQRLLGKRREP
jgi:hypothetical protein